MSDPKSRMVRDILIIVCVIVLAVLVYIFRSSPKPVVDLGDDLAGVEQAQARKPMGMGGHSLELFPEDVEGNVAKALGNDISRAELNRKANRILGPMAFNMEETTDREQMEEDLLLQALNQILSRLIIFNTAEELGLDIEEIGEKALEEWSEGYESAEAKLAAISPKGITIDDQKRLITKESVERIVMETITREMTDADDSEIIDYFTSWLTSKVFNLDIEFHDSTLESGWTDFLEQHATMKSEEDSE